MSVDTTNSSSKPLFETLTNLRFDDDPLWLPPKPWEQSHAASASKRRRGGSHHNNQASAVSEESLVRLAMNAFQGVESALLSIEKISAAFCSDPTDRTFHKFPSLWSRSSSTHALGEFLRAIGRTGCLVFLLHKLVEFYTNPDLDKNLTAYRCVNSETVRGQICNGEVQEKELRPYSLVNQAFAVAVGKVLEGYICALDTLRSSVGLRRASNSHGIPRRHSSDVGCLTSVVHPDITLLEVFLHTEELRTRIESLGNICHLHHLASSFSVYPLNDLLARGLSEFCKFPYGGDLLTYLFRQLQVADPPHTAVLKFVFIKACEPYCGLIRSWIYKAEVCDPYGEFIVEYVDKHPSQTNGKAGIPADYHLASIKERGGVAVPCFLKNFLSLIIRSGQQLQVLMKLLEICNVSVEDYDDFLPSWSEFSSNNLSSLTFDKRDIEVLVAMRNDYYKRMQVKINKLLAKLEVVSSYSTPDIYDSCGRSIPDSFWENSGAIACSAPDEKGFNIGPHGANSEASSTVDEEDPVELSDGSSLNSSDEDTECGLLSEFPKRDVGWEKKIFSVLKFSPAFSGNDLSQKLSQNENSGDATNNQNRENTGQTCVPFALGKPVRSNMFDLNCTESLPNFSWPLGGLQKNPFSCDGKYGDDKMLHWSGSSLKVTSRCMGERTPFSGEVGNRDHFLLEGGPSKDHRDTENFDASVSPVYQAWRLKYQFAFLSRNPMLTRNIFCRITSKPRDNCSRGLGQSFRYIQFQSVEDPCKEFVQKLTANMNHGLESELSISSNVSSINEKVNNQISKGFERNCVLTDKTEEPQVHSSLDIEELKQDGLSTNVSGGSSWESLLCRPSKLVNSNGDNSQNILSSPNNNGDNRQSISSSFEMPLDFIIDNCLLQELSLQYNYVSTLTIKLLEEGFDLHNHLLALRRYHFMEFADWADLFIMSLQHHKWHITGTDQRVPEIQGLLELSIQRSSCERDHYKNHLYVYKKGGGMMPFSTSTIEVHSFDFLGLGYRVDWPISIVLTPKALKIYADIFNFLVQVKLAVFALTDIWSSLKEFMHIIDHNRHSGVKKQEVHQFNIIVKTRHQVNHFVSTLQQYVQSQLSHVSWSKFVQSLEHKVRDMMDLESVHMAYLNDALNICFLSVETRSVACIVGSILQCALDFRSYFCAEIWNVRMDQGDLLDKISKINISKVLAIQEVFNKNMKELHICYLKSPKHRESGISRFWEFLNFNEYYSYADNELSLYTFSI